MAFREVGGLVAVAARVEFHLDYMNWFGPPQLAVNHCATSYS